MSQKKAWSELYKEFDLIECAGSIFLFLILVSLIGTFAFETLDHLRQSYRTFAHSTTDK